MNQSVLFIVVLFVIAGVCLLAMLAIALLYSRYKGLLKKKNMKLFQQLHDRDLLAKELEQALVEKELLEKMLTDKLMNNEQLKSCLFKN
jgi:Tfp pilus assembly protein PilN